MSTAAMLHIAARAICPDCPIGHRVSLHTDLATLIRLLREKHSTSLNDETDAKTLAMIVPIILDAEKAEFSAWSLAAMDIARHGNMPMAAYTHLGPVKDAASFRLGISHLSKDLKLQQQHEQLRKLVKQTQASANRD